MKPAARLQAWLYPQRLRRAARRIGFDIVRADFYSPIPDLASLPTGHWAQPALMPGVDLRLRESLELLTGRLAPHIAEYAPPDRAPGTRHGYYHDNGMYPVIDAEVLYGLLREFRPRRIVEVGAGFSTLVVSDAVERNAADGEAPARSVFDPFPSPVLASAAVSVQALRAQDIPASVFEELGTGDFLIIDTTHTVKPGSDVVRLVLEVLPALNPGVVIHIHDFFRPYDYPRWLLDEHALYWQEHYLVQALLAHNPDFEVMIANYALARSDIDAVAAIIPGADRVPGDAPGSALWLRRTP